MLFAVVCLFRQEQWRQLTHGKGSRNEGLANIRTKQKRREAFNFSKKANQKVCNEEELLCKMASSDEDR